MAQKSKINQTLSSSNFIYKVRYMIRAFMIYLNWTPPFLHKVDLLDTKIKIFKLGKTHDAKLDSN